MKKLFVLVLALIPFHHVEAQSPRPILKSQKSIVIDGQSFSTEMILFSDGRVQKNKALGGSVSDTGAVIEQVDSFPPTVTLTPFTVTPNCQNRSARAIYTIFPSGRRPLKVFEQRNCVQRKVLDFVNGPKADGFVKLLDLFEGL
jgi:hypothetical protein